MGVGDTLKGVFGGGLFSKKARGAAKDFFLGSPEIRENVSTLRPEQEPLYQQAVNSGLNKGAGGVFGESADYYRNNLSDNPSDLAAYSAPALRQYNEEIVPGISEQFAGMGSGGLSSSGFRNSQTQGGVDLAERIAQIRANLRHSSAQGLTGIGQIGLGNYSQNMVTQPGSEGFLSQAAPAIGHAALAYATGGTSLPASAAMMQSKNSFGGNKVGYNSSPYGGNNSISASPQSNNQLPRFGAR